MRGINTERTEGTEIAEEARENSGMRAEAGDEEGAGEEENGRGGEGGLDVESTPKEPDQEAGEEVAHGIDGGERAKGHAVLLLGNQLGGQRVFKGFFGAHVETGEDEDDREQPQGVSAGAKQERCDAGQRVSRCEDGFSAWNMVAQPAAQVSGAGVKHVMQSVETDGDARGARRAMARCERPRCVQDEHGVREISGAEDPYADEQSAEGKWQGFQAEEERTLGARFDGLFANEQPEYGDGDETRQKRPKKNLSIGVAGRFEQPESRKWAGDGAYRVHQSFEAEGAAVGMRRYVGGEKGLFRGRTHAAAEPRGDAAEEHMIGVRREGKRSSRERGEGVSEYSEWLAAFQAIGVVTGREFGEAGEAVGDAFDGA